MSNLGKTVNKKPIIIVLCDYYLPGYKSGGGMRTIVNMVDRLHNKFDFRIITRDYESANDLTPYKEVKINEWNRVGNAEVFYLSQKSNKISTLRKLILKLNPDSIYFNSFFSNLSVYSLCLRRLGLIPELRYIMAPCGELSSDALAINNTKKSVFLTVSKILDLYKDLVWKASSAIECEEIYKVLQKKDNIFVSPDLLPKTLLENYEQNAKPLKKTGEAKMIFLSRFVKIKNFKQLLEVLLNIKGSLIIDLYGPIEDELYWNECVEIIKKLPVNITVKHKGSIPHEEVAKTLFDYHFFVLPTRNENFGHVFIEALAAGCPLVISNKTPWLDLVKKGIGWDLPLDNLNGWEEVLNNCIEMNNEHYSKISNQSREFALKWLSNPDLEAKCIKVLEGNLRQE